MTAATLKLDPANFVLEQFAGPPLRIRPSNPNDRDKLGEFFQSLSAPARCNRFLSSVAKVSASVLDLFATADQANHVALVATQETANSETIIAEARYVISPQNRLTAEFALTVADDWQGHGIGRHLLSLLEKLAGERRLQSLWGDTTPANLAMIGLASQCGFGRRRHPQDFKLARLEKAITA